MKGVANLKPTKRNWPQINSRCETNRHKHGLHWMQLPKRISCWLVLFLLMNCTTLFAQSQTNLPLTENELRQILSQLYELKELRVYVAKLEALNARSVELDARDAEQDAAAKTNYQEALRLKDREIAIEKERGDTLKLLLDEALKRGNGAGYYFCKIFTLGIARCK